MAKGAAPESMDRRERLQSGLRRAVLDPVAAVALEELEGEQTAIDSCLIEVLAEHIHATAASPAAEDLCRAAGCSVVLDPEMPPGYEGLAFPTGKLVARPRRDQARTRLTLLHELAHVVLARSGIPHTHADVWMLTLALGAPMAVARKHHDAVALAAETGLPAWAAEARLRILSAPP